MESIKKFNVFTPKEEGLADINNDFITIASHQLRTPITAVRWVLDIVLSDKLGHLNDKQRHAIKLAYHNNLFLARLVNDILRFSRLESGSVKFSPKSVDVKNLIKKITEKYRQYAFAGNCRINLKDLAKNNKAYIDLVYFSAIIDSLINNAITYSRPGGDINVSLKNVKNFLVLEIKDFGIGIPANQQSQIFTKFFRAKNAMKTQAGGLGLNLYVAKKVCEAFGGKIEFKSEIKAGTIFTLYLPTKKDQISSLSVLREEGPNELLKKEREFVNITIHELKAPLGVSKWSLEMLMNDKVGNLNKTQFDLLNRIYHGNERLLVLVGDLLNLAKLQEGKFPLKPRLFEAVSLVNEIVAGFEAQAKAKKIKIDWLKPKEKYNFKTIDPDRIAQVITNLLSNAIKYTPDGGKVKVDMKKITPAEIKQISQKSKIAKIENIKNQKGYLVFSFKDNGIGISKQDQEKLFSRFFRSSKVLESKAEGTGLGLFITKSIVSLHKGDIWFESLPAHGSTFYFSLPIN